VNLTSKEYRMLELLSLRRGTTITKEMFLSQLYGGMDEPEIKIIDVFMCKIRKKLAIASGGKDYIETVWGRGYLLRDPHRGQGEEPPLPTAGLRDPFVGGGRRRGVLGRRYRDWLRSLSVDPVAASERAAACSQGAKKSRQRKKQLR
jgi:Transcriptional regulatory protein, C terminal